MCIIINTYCFFAVQRISFFSAIQFNASMSADTGITIYKGDRDRMNIGILAHNSKKSLIEDFCIAYKGILMKHDLYATGTTGKRIENVTNLHVHKFLAGAIGGDKQFMEMIGRGAMDLVILFYNPSMVSPKEPDIMDIVRCCDQYSIPVATNIATAETLILGLARGDLDWREQFRQED